MSWPILALLLLAVLALLALLATRLLGAGSARGSGGPRAGAEEARGWVADTAAEFWDWLRRGR